MYIRVAEPFIEDFSTFTQEKCRELIDPCVGPGVKYGEASINIWFTDPRIASSYATEDYRVFFSQEMQHIPSRHNVAWK